MRKLSWSLFLITFLLPVAANSQNIITTVAGNGSSGFSGDGGLAASAGLNRPYGVAVDSAGNIYIGDTNNNRIRRVDTSGIITTVAGNGTVGYSGDGGPAASASLNYPVGVTVDSAGNIYIADAGNNRIRKVDHSSGNISTVAGNGSHCSSGTCGDGGPATSAELSMPEGVAVDGTGNLHIADSRDNRIRKVDTSGIITTVAGKGNDGFSGDGGPATSANLAYPVGVAVDSPGNLYIADVVNQRIRKVDTSGIITTVAGNGTSSYSGDGGLAASAGLNRPYGVAVDSAGNIYIGDTNNNRIRRVDTSGIITTVAGNGTVGYSGDGGPATSASLNYPVGVTVDSAGNLYIPDSVNNRIRRVSASTLGDKAAALAKNLLRAPYGYGGKGYDFKTSNYVDAPDIFGGYNYNATDCITKSFLGLQFGKGVDCSGLVLWSFNKAFGATTQFKDNNPIVYPTADGQFSNNTNAISEADLKPGDLLFFDMYEAVDSETGEPLADHVAMYVGDNEVVEAYTCDPKYPSGNYVISSNLSTRAELDPIKGTKLQPCPSLYPQSACFLGYRRVSKPIIRLAIRTLSPVTLTVTDPDGFTITSDTVTYTEREILREIPRVLYYLEDTNNDDTVISPVLKVGSYLIQLSPKSGTLPSAVYGLEVEAGGSTVTLAQNVPVSDIPPLGYGLDSTGTTVSPFIPVGIDIKPGEEPNPINLQSSGKMPVVILSNTTFNALSQIDRTSLKFGRTGNEASWAFCGDAGEDVNGDGLPDLVCHFYTQTADFQAGDTEGIMTALSVDGKRVRGQGSIKTVP